MLEKFQAFLKCKDIEVSVKRYGIDALGAMAQGLFCLLFIVMSVITGFDWAEMILISFVLPAVISQTLMIQKTIEELRLELWKNQM